ncbi:hypothetical protein [Paenisporosarcina antarctica]|uniref:Lipoprotein n=1 Tax=Paenisporosarcina antarctica TaxID=417367 RepID=A0A4P6ZUM5_9BACL|nr:hypothetical protein [Paenisporosarcina antarctica]QBP40180.1 hypothetical protein E2636_03000 [Paenisporosarcina antarctica]
MKYLSIGIILSLSLLTACTKGSTGDAMIKHAELTKFEESLVDLTSEHSFVFDLEINNEEITEVITIVDYYENGEFVRQVGNMSSEISQETIDDKIRVAFIQQTLSENEENWLMSVMKDDGHLSSSSPNNIDGKERINFASASGGVNEGPLSIVESNLIGSIAYSSNSDISVLKEIKTKEDIKKATDYEQAYLISVELR